MMKWPQIDFNPIMKWAGRWILPILMYGLGFGALFPMLKVNMLIGWRSQEGMNSETSTNELNYESNTCQTFIYPDGTTMDTCNDIVVTEDINIFETGGWGFTEFLLPINLIAGIIFLAIAYKLTPKPK